LAEKGDAVLISPAVYEPGTTRKNVNVVGWAGWIAVDIDEGEFNNVEEEIHELVGEYSYVIYSTASSTREQPKFRIVFEVDRFINSDEIRAIWFAITTKLGHADKQCKDYSRMYYIPAKYANSYSFFFVNVGSRLGVDKLLKDYPYAEKKHSVNFMDRLPEDLQQQVMEHRRSSMDASYSWNGYQDCPFWPKKLAMEYEMLSETGWYAKMYQIMVATAGHAIFKNYPITSQEISELCKEFDRDNGNWYENRPIEVEADRAIEYAYRKG